MQILEYPTLPKDSLSSLQAGHTFQFLLLLRLFIESRLAGFFHHHQSLHADILQAIDAAVSQEIDSVDMVSLDLVYVGLPACFELDASRVSVCRI